MIEEGFLALPGEEVDLENPEFDLGVVVYLKIPEGYVFRKDSLSMINGRPILGLGTVLEGNENAIAAAKRIVLEKTGIEPQKFSYMRSIKYIDEGIFVLCIHLKTEITEKVNLSSDYSCITPEEMTTRELAGVIGKIS